MMKEKIARLMNTGFLHIFGSGFFNKITAFLSSFILIKLLSKSQYGIYSYAQNTINLFMIVSGFGIVSGLLQIFCENSNDDKKINQYMKKGTIFGVSINFILALVIFVYSFFAEDSFDGLKELLRVMMFIPLFDLCYELILSYYRGKSENKKYSYISTINSILVLSLSILGALLYDAIGLVIGRILSSLITIIISFVLFQFPYREILHSTFDCIDEWRAVLKLSFISMLNNSASIIMQNIDGLLLGLLLTDSNVVASYKVATYIPTGLAFLPQMLVVYIYPFFASHRSEKTWLREKYKNILLIFGSINLIITILTISLSGIIIPLVFGKQYDDAIVPLNILMVTYFFNATFRNISGNLLASQRKVKANLLFGIVGIIVNILADILLIPSLGATGAALATFCVVFSVALISTIYLFVVLKK